MSIQDDFKKAARSLAMGKHTKVAYVRNSDGNVATNLCDAGVTLFILDDLEGPPNNGKNDKTGTDGRNGTNEYRCLELPIALCKLLCQSVECFLKLISRH